MTREPGSRYLLARDREWIDGTDGVRYVKLATEPGNSERPLAILSELPANHVEPPHTHDSSYMEIIIRGDIRVGKADLCEGDVRIVRGGVGYGPLITGASGCLRLTIFDRADGSTLRPLGKAAAAE